ncbi:NAD(P)H-dependent glycerol-3-phosphate dehydrogenase [Puniceibacterium sediminis]|uniref:Glycerol-3-phosphate dehydrogenase [NAD(P)+] n=1 Tax=Puniceibacterium sediminis TaxID=1608407 RepID=A0A238WVX2_9RHOB|nr:NAD(P)H-dependent glycerol-3-phosphate dehydrogenase [Puniceibacterium sediminis]SNR50501.1 glycerol-3-phosphate dehydrogenase (NAD(P)+) [Puniceibacterium sediminis]
MSIAVLGAGAFGSALAIALVRDGRDVTLWGRDTGAIAQMRENRRAVSLPDVILPDALKVSSDLDAACTAKTLIIATPAQTLPSLLGQIRTPLAGKPLVAACKGLDLGTWQGPSRTIADAKPGAFPLILTGPSFAIDIAAGLPTALTLACADADICITVQKQLSTRTLRLYRSSDPVGAELGGALKNVIAIACGACIGAGLGDSARAALMTRGFAEMQRLALALGAQSDTLMGLSGLGDLALTCTSPQSRNYRLGLALGRGDVFDPSITVEGAATARAVTALAQDRGIDLPICATTAALTEHRISITDAMDTLLSRPLKEE